MFSSSIDDGADLYAKGLKKKPEKAGNKIRKLADEVLPRLRDIWQPVAWTALPLFRSNSFLHGGDGGRVTLDNWWRVRSDTDVSRVSFNLEQIKRCVAVLDFVGMYVFDWWAVRWTMGVPPAPPPLTHTHTHTHTLSSWRFHGCSGKWKEKRLPIELDLRLRDVTTGPQPTNRIDSNLEPIKNTPNSFSIASREGFLPVVREVWHAPTGVLFCAAALPGCGVCV